MENTSRSLLQIQTNFVTKYKTRTLLFGVRDCLLLK